ncbi:hypothetical protein G7B40_038845 [Aetokthonos hydrillicola Thurmond2011]|uniref:Uncharacterized protein n=2 Tax=Aetokthonos TaxID=1550243 RepID=A0AAP5IFS4_9CYAN|nr:hypothetical protein [Aetokthonos hydrillicola]MDR9900464.1 hypothetical protein [Aetokthonos hydrillicola Thurmond2011]
MVKSIVQTSTISNTHSTQSCQGNSEKKNQVIAKGWQPAPQLLGIVLSSFAAVLTVSQSAFAQLNVGRYGVQPGLESEYLQYQMSGRDLSQMRGIGGCTVGFGLACNKTGSILHQLLESNNKATYQQLLIRAAGGLDNFQNFASFYGNNPNVSLIPYASFWQNDSPSIMDGYRYVLGSPVGQSPVDGLGLVTKNFYWSPISEGGSALSPRSGLLDLKYSFGRLLLEEVAKIPNIEQQIQALNLPPQMTNYYLSTLSTGLRALDSGNSQQIQQSILHVLSAPYSPSGGEFHRPTIGVPREFDQLYGQGLPGDEIVGAAPVLLDPEVAILDFPTTIGETFSTPDVTGGRFPGWLFGLGGAGLLALLLLAGGGGDKSSSSSGGSSPVNDFSVTPSLPPGVVTGGPNGGGNTTTSQGGPNGGGGTVITQKVPEPDAFKALVIMIIVLWIVGYKQWRTQTRN